MKYQILHTVRNRNVTRPLRMEILTQLICVVVSAIIGSVPSAWRRDITGIAKLTTTLIRYLIKLITDRQYIFLEWFRLQLVSAKNDGDERRKKRRLWLNLNDQIKQKNVPDVKYGLKK